MSDRSVGPVPLTPGDWCLAEACCGNDDTASAQWSEWRAGHDVDEVPDHAYPFLVALGGRTAGGLPPDEAGRLRGLHRRNWYVVHRLGALVTANSLALHDHGVQTALFGPLAVSAWVGGDPGWRLATGTDLLVRGDQIDDAVEVLTGRGFRVTRRPSRRRTSVAVLTSDGGLALRLHRVLPHIGVLGEPDDGPWRRRAPIRVADHPIEALSSPDLLVLATAPRLGWSGDDAVWPLDVHRLVGAHGSDEWWNEVVAATASTPWGAAVAAALAACRTHLGTTVPDDVLGCLALAPQPPVPLRAEQHARQALEAVRRQIRRLVRPHEQPAGA